MYNRILVAVDGSPTAELALQEAIKLARDQGATLRLLHIVDESPAFLNADTPFQLDEYERALRENGERVLEAARATVRAAGVGAEVKLHELMTARAHPADEIAAEAERWGADLIVIGTHGRRGFRRLFLGSVAEGVARKATRPVLLVRLPDIETNQHATQRTGETAG